MVHLQSVKVDLTSLYPYCNQQEWQRLSPESSLQLKKLQINMWCKYTTKNTYFRCLWLTLRKSQSSTSKHYTNYMTQLGSNEMIINLPGYVQNQLAISSYGRDSLIVTHYLVRKTSQHWLCTQINRYGFSNYTKCLEKNLHMRALSRDPPLMSPAARSSSICTSDK